MAGGNCSVSKCGSSADESGGGGIAGGEGGVAGGSGGMVRGGGGRAEGGGGRAGGGGVPDDGRGKSWGSGNFGGGVGGDARPGVPGFEGSVGAEDSVEPAVDSGSGICAGSSPGGVASNGTGNASGVDVPSGVSSTVGIRRYASATRSWPVGESKSMRSSSAIWGATTADHGE